MSATDLVFDVTTAEFAERVLKRSSEVPVVVDFWADWCGPCRMLGPLLEKVVHDLGGRVLLAKVDTDREPELAARYRIQGIPAVKAFRDGRLVAEFVGAQDARYVRAFFERLVPSPEEQTLQRAAHELERGGYAAAEALVRPLAEQPGAPPDVTSAALLILAEALLGQGRLHEVAPLLQRVDPRSPDAERAEKLARLVQFLEAAPPDAEGEAAVARRAVQDPGDLDARFALAAARARAHDHAAALELLLGLVATDRRYRDDGARKVMLLLFEHLGTEHELTQEYRRRLQVLL